jgi:hypothetical protein
LFWINVAPEGFKLALAANNLRTRAMDDRRYGWKADVSKVSPKTSIQACRRQRHIDSELNQKRIPAFCFDTAS